MASFMTSTEHFKADRHLTNREIIGPMTDIRSREDAKHYFDAAVEHVSRVLKLSRYDAERVLSNNVRYYVGYYDLDTSRRVISLFPLVR
jgi:hypothetical protein